MSSETTYGGNTTGQNRSASPSKLELHSVDLATWEDRGWSHPSYSTDLPEELDEPWPYRFTNGQKVWVRASDGEWYHGKVVGQPKQGRTRFYMSLFWCAEYRVRKTRVRKWFAPLNGEIKPDTEHTHQLLTDAGWLETDSNDSE